MSNLARSIQAANKHLLILLLGRQELGESDWPGYEALSIDSGIPQGLVEKAIKFLRQKGLLKVFRALGAGVHSFRVPVKVLEKLAFESGN